MNLAVCRHTHIIIYYGCVPDTWRGALVYCLNCAATRALPGSTWVVPDVGRE